ncbi:putative transposase [Trichonephila clavipes]|nr:putative transposase [Trichonephila clavipes]
MKIEFVEKYKKGTETKNIASQKAISDLGPNKWCETILKAPTFPLCNSIFRWFKAFSEGKKSIEDKPRSGRPSVSKTTENVVRVRDLVRSDRRLTLPYSPYLSPCDFFLFPKLKNHLKGHHFGTLENIQMAVTDQLKAIPISEFHQCYEEWKKRLQRCVASEGSYFEGDNVEL